MLRTEATSSWRASSWLPAKLRSSTNQPPAISVSTAAGLTVLFTVIYIAPFYLSSTLRSTAISNRNNPAVIKARARAVGLTCLACTGISVLVLVARGGATASAVLRLIGLYPVHLIDVAKCLLLVAILFVGPLFEFGFVEGNWPSWFSPRYAKEAVWDDWQGLRNIIIGPASEELVFRSLAIPLFLLAKATPTYITFVTPLIFGLAHLHHLHEFIVARQRPDKSYIKTALTPSVLLPGVIQVLVMFTYTSLFGFFEAFLYLRTGNFWACFAAHAFCNSMGLPRFFGRVGKGMGKAASREGTGDAVGGVQNVRDNLTAESEEQDLGIGWTIVYYILLAVGAVSFKMLLWPLTSSDLAMASF